MPNKPFNITLLHPAGFIHALALKEAADYLHATLNACGYRAVRTVNHVADDAVNVIFCAHLLKGELIQKIPSDTIIFNSEALEDANERQFYSDAYREILNRFFIWDYSHRNLPLIPHDNKSVVPFLYCAALRRSDVARDPGPSLLFYGRITPRRKRILETLQRSGVPVRVVFGEYEYQRDVHMLGSWAVLNLHKHDDTPAFEPIRCFYPLINDVPVISEDVDDPSAGGFRDSMFFLDRASFIEEVVALYGDLRSFEQRSRVMLAAFKTKDPRPDLMAAVEHYLAWCSRQRRAGPHAWQGT